MNSTIWFAYFPDSVLFCFVLTGLAKTKKGFAQDMLNMVNQSKWMISYVINAHVIKQNLFSGDGTLLISLALFHLSFFGYSVYLFTTQRSKFGIFL